MQKGNVNTLNFGALTERVESVGNDPRMRFRNSADPIYVAFDYLDDQPLSTLATSFVKESFNDVIKFVSKVVKAA